MVGCEICIPEGYFIISNVWLILWSSGVGIVALIVGLFMGKYAPWKR